MTQQKSFRDRLPFPAAAVFAFLYLTFNIINRFITDIELAQYWDWGEYEPWYVLAEVDTWLYLVLILTLAVLLLVKIPNVGITVTLGLLTATNIYWLVLNSDYLSFEYFDIYNLTDIITVVACLLLTIQSVSTYTKSRMAFCTATWFLPGLLEFTNLTIFIIEMLNGSVENLLRYTLSNLFYCLFILFVGKWLAEVSRIKHPDPNRANATPYNFRAPQPTFVQPPVPTAPPMPRVPIAPVAPVAAPVPQAPFVPQPAKADPVEELKKYKEMLDNELITQEEYDAKKKQLLGL